VEGGGQKVDLTERERVSLAEELRLRSCSTSDKGISETIAKVYDENAYVIDPHTAVAVAAAFADCEIPTSNVVKIVMACAHPAKFSEAVSQSLGGNVPMSSWISEADKKHPAVADILNLRQRASAPTTLSEHDGVHHFKKGEDWTTKLKGLLASLL